MKKLILAILVFLFVSASAYTQNVFAKSDINLEVQYNENINEDYTYEWVLIEGVWWIYVYDEDGKLINAYPAD